MIDNKCYTLDLAPVPMDENTFNRIIPDIIGKMQDQEDDFLVVGYRPFRKDHLSTIQTCKDGANYHIELVIYPNGEDAIDFVIYGYDTSDFNETVSLFKQVIVFDRIPAEVKWRNITNLGKYLDY